MNWPDRLRREEKEFIAAESEKAEKLGRLTEKQLQLIYRQKWFHLLVPAEIGGAEMDLVDFALLMEEMARVDGSFAWAVNLGAGANMFAGFMKPAVAKEIFGSEKACVAGSGAVGGEAEKKKEGFMINGRWKYASGAKHATHFSFNSPIDGDVNNIKSFLMPLKYVEILETWQVMGLKATSSCDFIVENGWVPHDYSFDLQEPSPYSRKTLYRFPFMILAEINMLVMLTGLAKSFFEQCMQIAEGKIRKTHSSQNLLLKEPLFEKKSKQLLQRFEDKRKVVFGLLEQIWNKVGKEEEIGKEEEEQFTNSVLESAVASRKMVDGIYPLMAMSVVFEKSKINRTWRDFKVASQHALLSEMRGKTS